MTPIDELREALRLMQYRPSVIFRARSGREVCKFIAPNGAPILVETMHHTGGVEVYAALVESERIEKVIAALRIFAARD
jgi:hypothetical protein